MWIVDFGVAATLEDAARYEAPFAYVDEHVKPERQKNNRQAYREVVAARRAASWDASETAWSAAIPCHADRVEAQALSVDASPNPS